MKLISKHFLGENDLDMVFLKLSPIFFSVSYHMLMVLDIYTYSEIFVIHLVINLGEGRGSHADIRHQYMFIQLQAAYN